MSSNDADLIAVGHIIGAHGVRGQVKVHSLTSPRENIVKYSPWMLEHRGQQIESQVTGRRQGKNVIAQLDSIEDRDQAEALTGASILIRRQQLPELAEGEYYWSQLIGLKVFNLQDVDLGHVDQMIETGANDVLVVQGDRERLVPYVIDDVIKSVDLDTQKIVVDWPADF